MHAAATMATLNIALSLSWSARSPQFATPHPAARKRGRGARAAVALQCLSSFLRDQGNFKAPKEGALHVETASRRGLMAALIKPQTSRSDCGSVERSASQAPTISPHRNPRSWPKPKAIRQRPTQAWRSSFPVILHGPRRNRTTVPTRAHHLSGWVKQLE